MQLFVRNYVDKKISEHAFVLQIFVLIWLYNVPIWVDIAAWDWVGEINDNLSNTKPHDDRVQQVLDATKDLKLDWCMLHLIQKLKVHT